MQHGALWYFRGAELVGVRCAGGGSQVRSGAGYVRVKRDGGRPKVRVKAVVKAAGEA